MAPIFDLLVHCTNFIMRRDDNKQTDEVLAAQYRHLLIKLKDSGRAFYNRHYAWPAEMAQLDSEQLSVATKRRRESMHTWLDDFMSLYNIPHIYLW